MTDKVQKIREEVVRLKSNLVYGACSSQIAMETRCKEEAYDEVLALLDSLQEEPISEDLDKAVVEYITQFSGENYYNSPWVIDSTGMAMPKELARFGAKWHKQQMMAKAIDIEMKVDAGGYPYIPQMELYDYDKDIPLAKEGDKYKVILIKED